MIVDPIRGKRRKGYHIAPTNVVVNSGETEVMSFLQVLNENALGTSIIAAAMNACPRSN